jgi:hypothetical protein
MGVLSSAIGGWSDPMRSFSLMFAGTSACKVLSGVRLAWKVPCRVVARVGMDVRVGEVMADTSELGKDEVIVVTVGAWDPVVLLFVDAMG